MGRLGQFYKTNRVVEEPHDVFYESLTKTVGGTKESLLISKLFNLAALFEEDFGIYGESIIINTMIVNLKKKLIIFLLFSIVYE